MKSPFAQRNLREEKHVLETAGVKLVGWSKQLEENYDLHYP